MSYFSKMKLINSITNKPQQTQQKSYVFKKQTSQSQTKLNFKRAQSHFTPFCRLFELSTTWFKVKRLHVYSSVFIQLHNLPNKGWKALRIVGPLYAKYDNPGLVSRRIARTETWGFCCKSAKEKFEQGKREICFSIRVSVFDRIFRLGFSRLLFNPGNSYACGYRAFSRKSLEAFCKCLVLTVWYNESVYNRNVIHFVLSFVSFILVEMENLIFFKLNFIVNLSVDRVNAQIN